MDPTRGLGSPLSTRVRRNGLCSLSGRPTAPASPRRSDPRRHANLERALDRTRRERGDERSRQAPEHRRSLRLHQGRMSRHRAEGLHARRRAALPPVRKRIALGRDSRWTRLSERLQQLLLPDRRPRRGSPPRRHHDQAADRPSSLAPPWRDSSDHRRESPSRSRR